MRIGIVIGTVTLNRWQESLVGGKWRLVTPLSWDDLIELENHKSSRQFAAGLATEPEVAFDDLRAGMGSIVAITDGREAAAPFYPEVKPVDSYIAAILDHVQVVMEP